MNQRFASVIVFAVLLLAGCASFAGLFAADNKYTAALCGGYGYNVLQPDPERAAFLVDGWEYYPGQMLGPDDFADGVQAEQYTYIGQYPNFSAHLGSPYGVATYRLVLENPGEPVALALYLQELLCAGRIYVNGALIGEQGSLSPYAPRVMDGVYLFTAEQETEIIIQCVNYTHYYSGMYYAPAVGTSGAIFRMTALRFAVYGLLCFASLAVALSNLVQWARSGDKMTRWMGALCLAFAVRVSYPFVRALGAPPVRLLYALEDVSGNLVLLLAVLLAGELSGAVTRWYHRKVAVPAAAALCAASALFPLFILPQVPSLINLYGTGLFFWNLAAGLYLFGLTFRTMRTGGALGGMLLGVAGAYGVSVAASVVLANRFEPICGAWPVEYGGFSLVVGFAALMARRGALMAAENRRLTRHLQEEVDRKTHALEQLLAQRRELLANLVHDIKNPLAALRGYAELAREDSAVRDSETAAYLDALTARVGALRDRFDALQDFSRGERAASAQRICLNELLTDFYERNKPDIEMSGVRFLLCLPPEHLFVCGSEERLQTALENLCYNALSFTPPDGEIAVGLAREGQLAAVWVRDTGEGILPEDLPHVFERGFTRRADGGGEGLGLFIVHTVALEHSGSVAAWSQRGCGSAFTMRLPLCGENVPELGD